jgi:hypothetical protein
MVFIHGDRGPEDDDEELAEFIVTIRSWAYVAEQVASDAAVASANIRERDFMTPLLWNLRVVILYDEADVSDENLHHAKINMKLPRTLQNHRFRRIIHCLGKRIDEFFCIDHSENFSPPLPV